MATMGTCFKSVAQTVATVWFEYLKQWPLFWNSGHCFKYSLVLLYEPYTVISAPVSVISAPVCEKVATVSNRGRDYSVGLVEMYQRNSGHCFKQRLRLLSRARRTVPMKCSEQWPLFVKQEPRLLCRARRAVPTKGSKQWPLFQFLVHFLRFYTVISEFCCFFSEISWKWAATHFSHPPFGFVSPASSEKRANRKHSPFFLSY